MGTLHYGQSGFSIEIDDRALAHLKVVILTLLRNGQSIAFSFAHPTSEGSGRETIWITPTSDIRFHFLGSRAPQLNRAWIDAMLSRADGSTGLQLIPEGADLRRLVSVAS
ncbi:ATP-dependent DNA ligase [Herbiconiux sp. CPCC 205763]|uniref:ATP-dependent DNA ligase n=1 Tax=Herbiconiux aconitum TaxID=2970913 RepID=A0ABT2GRL0_9MICO|nr:ATP-dependent DNA ligase [Herbiconiux aconitum]MCS5718761.1 ATP-dependent DNA ligase [Herbiconiux aconitum]